MSIDVENIFAAAQHIREVVVHTPLTFNTNLSAKYEANIYLKREDLQVVRSYKIRGAYHKMATMTPEDLSNGVVCASAGNHARHLCRTPAAERLPAATRRADSRAQVLSTLAEAVRRAAYRALVAGRSAQACRR